MDILAPIDGSEPSLAALEFAGHLANRFDGSLDVVHITDYEDDATEELLERARETLGDAGVDIEPEVVTHLELDRTGASSKIGEHILNLVEERGYDHVVMGRHGGRRLERLVLGSTSKTVVEASEVPVTVVP